MLEPAKTNLSMIGMVNIHDKLGVTNDYLYINPPLWTRPLRRKMTGNNRDWSLEVIALTINATIEYSDSMINDLNRVGMRDEMEYTALEDMQIKISNCIRGLRCLKVTYWSDAKYRCALEGLIETLQVHHDSIRKNLGKKL